MPTSPSEKSPRALGLRLSTKVVLVVIAAVVATFVVICVSMMAIYEYSSSREWRKNALSLVAFASGKVIDNPDPKDIQQLADELGIDIRYTGPEGTYSTSPGVPTRSKARASRKRGGRDHDLPHGFSVFRHDDKHYLAHKVGTRQIIYGRTAKLRGDDWPELLLIPASALAFIVLIFCAVILYVRLKLKPLSVMTEQMESFGAQAVASSSDSADTQKDEIAHLTASFRRMRERVEDLLASKETLLRDVSHEFRSPLARMRLAMEFIDDEKTKSRIGENIEFLDCLAGELLERAKLDSGSEKPEIEPVNLGSVAASAIKLDEVCKKACKLSTPENPVTVLANRFLLERCLRNVLDNSLRYSRICDDSIHVSVWTEGDMGAVEVHDSGRQISPELIDKLFEPFFRPDESRARHMGGTGLGLAIVSSIVKALDGKIEADSPDAGGMRVRILLPLAGHKADQEG